MIEYLPAEGPAKPGAFVVHTRPRPTKPNGFGIAFNDAGKQAMWDRGGELLANLRARHLDPEIIQVQTIWARLQRTPERLKIMSEEDMLNWMTVWIPLRLTDLPSTLSATRIAAHHLQGLGFVAHIRQLPNTEHLRQLVLPPAFH